MKSYFKFGIVAVLALVLAFSLAFADRKSKSDDAWLGVYTQSVDYDLAEAFDLSVKYGAIINEIVEDSPAEEAGLEEGDIIVKFDGFRVTDSDDLSDMVDDSEEGAEVTILFIRDDDEKELTVTLGERPRRLKYRDRYDSPIINIPDIPGVPDVPRIVTVPRAPRAGAYSYSYGGSDSHGYIGASLSSLSKQLGEYFGVKRGNGALVTSVEEDSPAEEAGLKAGDVIIKFDDDRVSDPDDVVEIVRDMDEGDKVLIVVMRDKSETSLEIEIEEIDRDDVYIYGSGSPYRISVGPSHGSSWSSHWNHGDDFSLFENEDFLEDMTDFREAMEDLKETKLEELLESREFKRERGDLKRELQKLQRELKRLQDDLQ